MTIDPVSRDDLDGPVAAPDHHRILFEDDHVRVIETVIRAGDTAPLHTHLVPHLVHFTSGSQFVRRDASGAVLLDTRSLGPATTIPEYSWNDGLGPHTLENVGPDDIVATSIERKA